MLTAAPMFTFVGQTVALVTRERCPDANVTATPGSRSRQGAGTKVLPFAPS